MTDKRLLTAEEILTRVFNDGFVMGEMGMGDEKESIATALSELAKVDKVCPDCKGSGKLHYGESRDGGFDDWDCPT